MEEHLRITLPTRQVLTVLLSEPFGQHYAMDVARQAGLPLGSVYPILARLQRAGWVTSGQEAIDPETARRRPRRHYQLTGPGARLARQQLRPSPLKARSRLGRTIMPLPRPRQS